MSPQTQRLFLAGAAGRIELALDWPSAAPRGIAFIAHPHPLYGGTMDNKVVTTMARAFLALGWLAVRKNFRGVGATEGVHDAGAGETEDFLQVVEQVPGLAEVAPRLAPGLPVAYAGFSFGSFVASRAAELRPPKRLVLVGCAAGKWQLPRVSPETILIHGELDETIPLVDVYDWARPQDLPVIVMPGADHFFHRRLTQLKRLLMLNLQGCEAMETPRLDA